MKNSTIQVTDSSTLPGLFRQRCQLTPNAIAYRQFNQSSKSWISYSWKQTEKDINRWQASLAKYALEEGDRVAIMVHNCHEWVLFEQAALNLGLVIVPIYINDRADNIAYVINNSESKLLFLAGNDQWQEVSKELDQLNTLETIISIRSTNGKNDPRLITLNNFLIEVDFELQTKDSNPNALATIVYTRAT